MLAGALCALLALPACAAASDPSAQPAVTSPTTAASTTASASSSVTPSATPEATATAEVRTIAVNVRGRTVTPAPAVVALARGETLRLVVTSDHDDELHAHGFEVEAELTAGQPTTVELTGGEPGRYEVETHHPSLRLMVVQVR